MSPSALLNCICTHRQQDSCFSVRFGKWVTKHNSWNVQAISVWGDGECGGIADGLYRTCEYLRRAQAPSLLLLMKSLREIDAWEKIANRKSSATLLYWGGLSPETTIVRSLVSWDGDTAWISYTRRSKELDLCSQPRHWPTALWVTSCKGDLWD